MRRRPLTALLACAALAAPAAASAQTLSTQTPASTETPASTSVPGSTLTPASTTTPASSVTPASTATPTSTTTPAVSGKTPGPPADGSSRPWVLLAVVGALLLLATAAWGAARWWAWEPAWLVRTRHASAEAGWRTSAAWAEFRDWIRLGR